MLRRETQELADTLAVFDVTLHPGVDDQRRRQRVHRDPGGGEPGGQEVGQPVQPGLGRGIMRADDASGERGD